jgi:hypothetical protein
MVEIVIPQLGVVVIVLEIALSLCRIVMSLVVITESVISVESKECAWHYVMQY